MPLTPRKRLGVAWLAAFALLTSAAAAAAAKEPCSDQNIKRPEPPAMIEADLTLLKGPAGQPPLPEWSKVEKLRGFYRRLAESKAPCAIVEGEELGVRLFTGRKWVEEAEDPNWAGRFASEQAFQFYGSSRLKVERSDKSVTREYAFPISGPATLAEAAPQELPVLLEDLAQLQLVAVPRLRFQKADGSQEDCFLISQVTAVPSRVFDEPAEPADPSQPRLTLDARRRSLELVARHTKWLQRVEKEEPGCRVNEEKGYLARQITSLNLTIGELVPDLDFAARSLRFWREVDQRIEKLRAQDEGWKKEIGK